MKKYLLFILIFFGISLFGLLANSNDVSAFDPFGSFKSNVCDSASTEAQSTAPCTETGANNPIAGESGILIRVTDFIALISGVAAVVVIIIGGMQYILSSGDTAKTNTAKNTILFAVIGLVIIVAARSIIAFVINRL